MERPPEHLVSGALQRLAAYPEDRKFLISAEQWVRLSEKYGEDKVQQFYRLEKMEYTARVDVKLKTPVLGNG